jgi:hypothetical protein
MELELELEFDVDVDVDVDVVVEAAKLHIFRKLTFACACWRKWSLINCCQRSRRSAATKTLKVNYPPRRESYHAACVTSARQPPSNTNLEP